MVIVNKSNTPGDNVPTLEVQVRDEDGSLFYCRTIKEAMDMAKEHPSIWKISWTDSITDERIRLVKKTESPLGIIRDFWVYEPIVV
jgi:hypothetical protein